MSKQVELSDFEKKAGQRAHHRALIMQILHEEPGLTNQQIIEKELERYGYTFLTDNRLRELRDKGWVVSIKLNGLLHWYPTGKESVKG